MTIKDFKVGQTALVMSGSLNQKEKYLTYEVEVVKVGRKYVTVRTTGRHEMKFEETFGSRLYLLEKTEYGAARLLFSSNEAIEAHKEKRELEKWARDVFSLSRAERYTLAQLRAVKKILEEADHEQE